MTTFQSFPVALRRWCFPLFSLLLAVAARSSDLVQTVETRSSDFVQARLDGLTNTGDVMAYVLPATVLGLTLYFKDGEGAWQFGKSAAISMAITVGLKYAVNAPRPNGEPYSFPSGHATITFSSAEFMRQRYGWRFGVPAYLLASFVGYSRVHGHEHYYRDVIAGAAIGIVTTHLLTKPFHGWEVRPVWEPEYRGLKVSRTF